MNHSHKYFWLCYAASNHITMETRKWIIPKSVLALLLCKCPIKCHSMSSGSWKYILKLSDTSTAFGKLVQKQKKYLRGFLDDFLNVIFTKASMARDIELANERNRFGLRDCNDPNSLRLETRSSGRLPDPVHDRPKRREGCSLRHWSCHWIGSIIGGAETTET